MKVLVNIYNTGNLFGIKTPAYGVPMDESLYEFYKDMGFMIELAKDSDKQKPILAAPAKEATTAPANTAAVPAKKKRAKHIYVPMPGENDPRLSEAWVSKDVYTEEELKAMSKENLQLILVKRGHVSRKNGLHDPLAPKNLDRRVDLIEKILKTNKA